MSIELKNISAGYTVEYLKDINLKFQNDEWTFFIGETGSGKSTLLQTLAHLTKIFNGELIFNEKTLKDKKNLREFRDRVGVMFQYTEKQFFCNTVKEEIVYILKRKKLSEKEIEEKLEKVLDLLNFPRDILENSPFEISGGQKRFTALASILINEPKILLLDEPTAGLDIENKRVFYSVLERLKNSGVMIVQSSHTLEDVFKYGDRVIKFERGRVIKDGTPKEILLEEKTETMEIFRLLSKKGVDLTDIKSIEELCEVMLGE